MGKAITNRISASILLGVYLVLLIMPYYPYIYYYVYSSLSKHSETSIQVNHQDTILGDACYLAAIAKRAMDKGTKADVPPPPPPPVETSGMVYLNPFSTSLVPITSYNTLNFKRYMISIKETFLEIPVPPPRYINS